MKKLLSRLVIGFFGGAIIGNLMVLLFAESDSSVCSQMLLDRAGSHFTAMLIQSLLSALTGAVAMSGMSLYDESDLSLVSATVIHFIVIEAVFLPCALFLGWIRPAWGEIAIMAGGMAVAFVLIWFAMYVYYRREVRELNEINQNHKI